MLQLLFLRRAVMREIKRRIKGAEVAFIAGRKILKAEYRKKEATLLQQMIDRVTKGDN